MSVHSAAEELSEGLKGSCAQKGKSSAHFSRALNRKTKPQKIDTTSGVIQVFRRHKLFPVGETPEWLRGDVTRASVHTAVSRKWFQFRMSCPFNAKCVPFIFKPTDSGGVRRGGRTLLPAACDSVGLREAPGTKQPGAAPDKSARIGRGV